MAIHPNIPAWEIPSTEETGWRQFTGFQRVRHDWACVHIDYGVPYISSTYLLRNANLYP